MAALAEVDASVSTGPLTAPLVAALEQAWADIQTRHPEVPAAAVVLGAGSTSAAGGLKLGHFAAMRWHHGTDRLPEVFIGGEGLARGPVGVLGTLLHEAAHALADVRQIKDTSRQGRWHNARFKALAEELGIEVAKDPRLGWSPTSVPEATSDNYATTLTELGAALRLYRATDVAGGPTGKSKTPPPCICRCGRRIRVAPSVLAAGSITCGVCETDFEPDTDEESPAMSAPETTPRLVLSVEAAAELLSISRTRMFALIKTGHMRSIQVGRLRRVPADALVEYVNQLIAAQPPATEQPKDA